MSHLASTVHHHSDGLFAGGCLATVEHWDRVGSTCTCLALVDQDRVVEGHGLSLIETHLRSGSRGG